MPYKDEVKKKAYYHRHQKFYQADFINKNRAAWNKYNARRRKEKKANRIINIKAFVKEIDEENTPSFRATVIALMLLGIKMSRYGHLAKRLQYDYNELMGFVNNWKKNKIIIDDVLQIDKCESDFEFVIAITLVAGCGTGMFITSNKK